MVGNLGNGDKRRMVLVIPIVQTNNSYSKQNIVYLINGIDYNLSIASVFILNSNISVLRCI